MDPRDYGLGLIRARLKLEMRLAGIKVPATISLKRTGCERFVTRQLWFYQAHVKSFNCTGQIKGDSNTGSNRNYLVDRILWIADRNRSNTARAGGSTHVQKDIRAVRSADAGLYDARIAAVVPREEI
jgi:hypothetical protein